MAIITGLPCGSLARTMKDVGMILMSVYPALVRSARKALSDMHGGVAVRVAVVNRALIGVHRILVWAHGILAVGLALSARRSRGRRRVCLGESGRGEPAGQHQRASEFGN